MKGYSNMGDVEIARSVKLKKICDVAEEYGISEEYLIPYGKYKAKVDNKILSNLNDKKQGKLILVTSINPTPLGEGKTTVAIGLSDGLNKLKKKSVLALREPSLGPVFGVKGGATGGGYAQIVPMEDINLHFTGDIHSITSANNLISAVIDNHIFYGNELKFKKVTWKRCMDLNDRALRNVQVGLAKSKKMVPREDGFDITVASEIMAVLCLSEDLKDFERRISNIVVGYNELDNPITVKDLKIEGAVTVLMKDALMPNIVQTLEHNLAFVHGGPFANIAHGCNSIIATKMALKLGEYVVTEAGFGADLGAEKFVNIKCRKSGLKPSCAVCVATLKALKYHGGATVEECVSENMQALENGIENLLKHVDNIKNQYGINVVVAINKFNSDTEKDIKFLSNKLEEVNVGLSLTEVWGKGSEGALDLAQKVINIAEHESIKFVYKDEDSIKTKIEKVATKVYGANGVEYTNEAIEQIEKIEKLGFNKYPICIAKTQYSFSDDSKNLQCKEPFKVHVDEVVLKAGAEFIIVKTGKIMLMPGLPKVPSAENIKLDENQNIIRNFLIKC